MCKKGCRNPSHNHYEFDGALTNLMKPQKEKKHGKDGYFRQLFNTKPWDILKGQKSQTEAIQ